MLRGESLLAHQCHTNSRGELAFGQLPWREISPEASRSGSALEAVREVVRHAFRRKGPADRS